MVVLDAECRFFDYVKAFIYCNIIFCNPFSIRRYTKIQEDIVTDYNFVLSLIPNDRKISIVDCVDRMLLRGDYVAPK